MEILILILTLGILLVLLLFCFKRILLLKNQNKNKVKTKKIIGMYNHIAGLPISEDARCKLFLEKDKIIIESSGTNFTLYKDKLLDACIKTDTEIQKQFVSSAGGAIAGNALFGPIGALICGRVKEKKSITKTNYLIYTYEKDNSVDYIVFDILDGINSSKFISDFINSSNKKTKEITL